MILIADGGSTKVDWVVVKDKEEIFRVQTIGMNPNTTNINSIKHSLNTTHSLMEVKDTTHKVFFYGAGCSTKAAKEKLKNIFSKYFTKADIQIEEDTLAAVYACSKSPSIVAILGTGSNSCVYDGSKILPGIKSLGFLIMDEASGNYYGKKLLRDYYYKIMPDQIGKYFEKEYDLNTKNVISNLYEKDQPNSYLASLSKIMIAHRENKYIINLIKEGFRVFFKYRIAPLHLEYKFPIYFVGSVAHYFKNELNEVANEYNISIKAIIKRPIDNLVQHHISL